MKKDFYNLSVNEITEEMAIQGYNPFVYTKKGIGRLGKKAMESYIFYFDILAMLSQIAYEWENMPLEIPYYQIERSLFYYGIAGFTKDDVADEFVCLPAIIYSGRLDKYGEGKEYKLYSVDKDYNYKITKGKDGLICFNNSIKKGNVYLAYRYAKRLQMLDEIMDMNADQQKTPYVILANEKTKKTLNTIFTQVELGERAIYTTPDLDLEKVLSTLDINVDFKGIDLMDFKREIFNEACMYMGITANLSNKKERLITSEVKSEERRYDIFRMIGLKPREYFCKQVNKMYNIDLRVQYVLEEKELQEMENIVATSTMTKRKEVKEK